MFVRKALWLGPDHILRVRTILFFEEYRRYYFRDIQAIVVTELSSSVAYYLYIAAALLAPAAAFLAYTQHLLWAVICALLAAGSALLGIQRRNCACYLKTSISTEALPSLRRLRNARKAVGIIQPEVDRVQGTVSREALEHADLAAIRTAGLPASVALKHYSGRVHAILFGLLIACALELVIPIIYYSAILSAVSNAFSAAVLLLGIIAAAKQHRSDLPRGIQRVVKLTLGWYGVSLLAGIPLGIYIVLEAGSKMRDVNYLRHLPGMLALQYASILAYLILGASGWVLLLRHRGRKSTPPPLAVSEMG